MAKRKIRNKRFCRLNWSKRDQWYPRLVSGLTREQREQKMAYYRQQSLKEAFKDPDFLFGIAMNDGGIKKEISNVNIEKLGKYERKEYSLGELLRRQYGKT